MELENCSNCKWWVHDIGPDGKSVCWVGCGRQVWECHDKKNYFGVKIRTSETMCCDFYAPEEK